MTIGPILPFFFNQVIKGYGFSTEISLVMSSILEPTIFITLFEFYLEVDNIFGYDCYE